jgi:hypothetical protein
VKYLLDHKKKIIFGIGAVIYVGTGVYTGDMDMMTAANKLVTILNLGGM